MALPLALALGLVWPLAVVAAASVELRPCPAEAESGHRSSKWGQTHASFALTNDAGQTVLLSWVNHRGAEKLLERIVPGDEARQDTFVGHLWRVRTEDADELLLEFQVEAAGHRDLKVFSCRQRALEQTMSHEELAWLRQHGSRDGSVLARCPLAQLLGEEPLLGFHVVCLVHEDDGVVRLCVFPRGLEVPFCATAVFVDGVEGAAQLVLLLAKKLQLRPRGPAQVPMALFDESGFRVPDSEPRELLFHPSRQALVLMEGGVWQWPPVRQGFKRRVQIGTGSHRSDVELHTLETRPRVFAVSGLIEEPECDRILALSASLVKVSDVVRKDVDKGKPTDDWRTSQTHFLPSAGDEVLLGLDRKAQGLTRVPITHAEYIQVLKYDHLGRYAAHHDYFDPREYRNDPGTLDMIEHGQKNRVLTLFMYLSDVVEGGETFFPRSGGQPSPEDFGDCTHGLKVPPRRGEAILFYSMLPDGGLDQYSLHGGCSVRNGTKWSGNFWMWNKPSQYKSTFPYTDMASDLESQYMEERSARRLASSPKNRHEEL